MSMIHLTLMTAYKDNLHIQKTNQHKNLDKIKGELSKMNYTTNSN
jgi:hypothetical protein